MTEISFFYVLFLKERRKCVCGLCFFVCVCLYEIERENGKEECESESVCKVFGMIKGLSVQKKSVR